MYCEDGRDFIRSSFKRALTEPFPPFTGKRPSKRKMQKEARKSAEDKKEQDLNTSEPSLSLSSQANRNRVSHFVMNLPDSAIEFLDAFRGVLDQSDRELSGLYDTMPMVHCHCFTRFLVPAEAEADIRQVRG